MKFDPELARSLLREALGARSWTGCYRMLFDAVSRYATGPALTDVALETITDGDPQTAGKAVRYLTAYGDERSKAPILRRYLAWTDAWSGRGSELQWNFVTSSPNWDEEVLGEALGWALLASPGGSLTMHCALRW